MASEESKKPYDLAEFTNEKSIIDYESNHDGVKQGHSVEVKRILKARHISLIALGGSIGTGLFMSTGGILQDAGPVNALISVLFMASVVYSVTQSIGEMATYLPVTGSFTQFAARWVSPSFGAANGYMYFFSWAITFALEVAVVGQVIQFWTDAVPLAGWVAIFLVTLVSSNFAPVKYYGEIEFWIAMVKIVAVVGWLIYALIMVCGAGKTGPVGFRYWRNPGPWGPGILVNDKDTSRFLGFLSSLINSAFAFQGAELVGLSAGESKNPKKAMPSAIRKVLYRIIIFYVFSMFFMGLLVPFNDPLLDAETYSKSSPFLIAILNSGTKVLPHIFNVVILMTIISAGNSNVYSGSRILHSLGQAGVGPRFLCFTNRFGVPYISVIITGAFGLLGFMESTNSGKNVFNWLLNILSVAGLITWFGISFTHLRFVNILKSRGISRDTLPFKAALMPYLAQYSACTVFVIIFIQGYSCFFNITAGKFFTAYISNIVFVFIYIIAHFYYNGFSKKAFTKRAFLIPIEECDIDLGTKEIDELEWDDDEPRNYWEKFWDIVA